MKNKWKKKCSFTVDVDAFNVNVVFVCNENIKGIKKVLKKICGKRNFKKLDDKGALGGWDSDRQEGRMIPFMGGFIVLLKDPDGRLSTFTGLISHEITHVVQYLLGDRRIPLNEDTEEVYAYLTQHIVRQAFLELNIN